MLYFRFHRDGVGLILGLLLIGDHFATSLLPSMEVCPTKRLGVLGGGLVPQVGELDEKGNDSSAVARMQRH